MTFNLDDYEPVATRLSRWLNLAATGGQPRVLTEMVHRGDDWCVFKAELWIDNTLISTGWAEEHATERGVNATSHVENCETSAVGRALANAGIAGSDPSKRASREEMTKVQRAGGTPQPYSGGGSKPTGLASAKQKQFIFDLAAKNKFAVQLPDDLSFADASALIEALKSGRMLAQYEASEEEPF